MRLAMFKNIWGVVAAGLLCIRGAEALISADKLCKPSIPLVDLGPIKINSSQGRPERSDDVLD
jgi:hypothetical protein